MRSRLLSTSNKNISGFTLIEIIVGIIVLALSLSIITQMIIPTEQHSADQVHQIKAAELGQSLMDEIIAKAFDENSDKAGSLLRCDEDQDDSGTVEIDEKCTTVLGNEEGDVRADFDDVDDYHGYNNVDDGLKTSTGDNLHSGYDSFKLSVHVAYDTENVLQLGALNKLAKRITVTVTTPLGTDFEFTNYRANF